MLDVQINAAFTKEQIMYMVNVRTKKGRYSKIKTFLCRKLNVLYKSQKVRGIFSTCFYCNSAAKGCVLFLHLLVKYIAVTMFPDCLL